jgi:hypothetical protein
MTAIAKDIKLVDIMAKLIRENSFIKKKLAGLEKELKISKEIIFEALEYEMEKENVGNVR